MNTISFASGMSRTFSRVKLVGTVAGYAIQIADDKVPSSVKKEMLKLEGQLDKSLSLVKVAISRNLIQGTDYSSQYASFCEHRPSDWNVDAFVAKKLKRFIDAQLSEADIEIAQAYWTAKAMGIDANYKVLRNFFIATGYIKVTKKATTKAKVTA